jgi:hypothetical protein
MQKWKLLAAGALLVAAGAAHATPGRMASANDCVIVASGPGFGTCTETHNQVGLLTGYTEHVTRIHPYHAGDPMHTFVFAGNEWFSNLGTTSAIVSYYLDEPWPLNHFMHWNEESSGTGLFNLWYGAFPGDLADLVLAGIAPPDNPLADYGAQVYEFSPRPKTGWWTLEMLDCPQPDPGSFAACAVGEVAWAGIIPEPGTWSMLIAGFGLVGWAVRRQRTALA